MAEPAELSTDPIAGGLTVDARTIADQTRDGSLWGVGAVSSRLGIATPTLRTWDRRYGLGPGMRTEGGHRRYTETDVARVAMMSRLIDEGMSAAEAAHTALAADRTALLPRRTVRSPTSAREDRNLSSAISAIVEAAQALDAAGLSKAYSSTLERRGVVSGWTQVIVPAMREIGSRWSTGQIGIEHEHLASERLATELRSIVRGNESRRPHTGQVMLASAPGEQHSLPLLALEAALAERRISSVALGARTPTSALAAAVLSSQPRVVFVWASMPRHADDRTLAALPERTIGRVLLGGPGWDDVKMAHVPGSKVEHLTDLAAAVTRVHELVQA